MVAHAVLVEASRGAQLKMEHAAAALADSALGDRGVFPFSHRCSVEALVVDSATAHGQVGKALLVFGGPAFEAVLESESVPA